MDLEDGSAGKLIPASDLKVDEVDTDLDEDNLDSLLHGSSPRELQTPDTQVELCEPPPLSTDMHECGGDVT